MRAPDHQRASLDDVSVMVVPLAQTAGRLAALDAYLAAEVTAVPAGGDWYRLEAIVADGHLDRWLAALVAQKSGKLDVAGAYLGAWLAGTVVTVPVAALVLERRAPDVTATNVRVHRHPEGWFDRITFASPVVALVPDDPDAGHPHAVVVDDEAALWDWYAARLVATVEPLLSAVRSRSPYGLRGLWGAVADELFGTALRVARLVGGDGQAAWRVGEALADHIGRRIPHLRTRPRPFPVRWAGGESLFQVKGTCCLYYKEHDRGLDPCGESYCTTCPFRDDDDRGRRLRHHLEDREGQ